MRGKRLGRTIAAALASIALLLGWAGVASAAPGHRAAPSNNLRPADVGATLTSAKITFLTSGEDKDGDTTVSIKVVTAAGKTAASAFDTFGRFGDGSVVPVNLLVRKNITWDALQGGTVRLHIQPNGDDTWKFGYRLDLTFDDGDVSQTIVNRVSMSEDNRDHMDPIEF
ncbi:hypothetical protein ACFV29_32515 [Streptomyces sp. NPDC059690]|uniref:hypothetical protein n=1 Tax=Streptomyces sp. NPDC059690 TaxID=3346907 RepID=UPI0036C0E819